MTSHAQSDTEYYSLEALGYNPAYARAREELAMPEQLPARVISEAKHRYLVYGAHTKYSAVLPGNTTHVAVHGKATKTKTQHRRTRTDTHCRAPLVHTPRSCRKCKESGGGHSLQEPVLVRPNKWADPSRIKDDDLMPSD